MFLCRNFLLIRYTRIHLSFWWGFMLLIFNFLSVFTLVVLFFVSLLIFCHVFVFPNWFTRAPDFTPGFFVCVVICCCLGGGTSFYDAVLCFWFSLFSLCVVCQKLHMPLWIVYSWMPPSDFSNVYLRPYLYFSLSYNICVVLFNNYYYQRSSTFSYVWLPVGCLITYEILAVFIFGAFRQIRH